MWLLYLERGSAIRNNVKKIDRIERYNVAIKYCRNKLFYITADEQWQG